MKITLAMVVVCFLISGCAKPLHYKNVNFQDGVYDAEIIAVAEHELTVAPEKDQFAPKGGFVNNRFTQCLKDHKLVVFPGRKKFSKWLYYVVVNKNTGEIVKSGPMSPQKNSWAVMIRGIDGCYE